MGPQSLVSDGVCWCRRNCSNFANAPKNERDSLSGTGLPCRSTHWPLEARILRQRLQERRQFCDEPRNSDGERRNTPGKALIQEMNPLPTGEPG